jgi:hypothetical protein
MKSQHTPIQKIESERIQLPVYFGLWSTLTEKIKVLQTSFITLSKGLHLWRRALNNDRR